MNLLKILSNKDVQSGKIGFHPKGDRSHYYMVIPTDVGGVLQIHTMHGSFFGITPQAEILAGEWELFMPENVDK